MADYQTTAPTTTALSLEDAKRQVNVTVDVDDATILSKVKAATNMLEKRTNRAFVQQTRTLKMNTFYDPRYVIGRVIRPPVSPLRSVSSISYVDSQGTTTTMPSSDYIVSTGDQPGEIHEGYNATWPATRNHANDVTITYVAGHSTNCTNVPEHCKEAVRLVMAHWFRNREAVADGMTRELALGVDALLESEIIERYG